jgi:hypothetical protein
MLEVALKHGRIGCLGGGDVRQAKSRHPTSRCPNAHSYVRVYAASQLEAGAATTLRSLFIVP